MFYILILLKKDDDLGDSLLYSRAYWVGESIIAWNVDVPDGSCYLYASRTAALSISYDGIQGFYSIDYNFRVGVKKFCLIKLNECN